MPIRGGRKKGSEKPAYKRADKKMSKQVSPMDTSDIPGSPSTRSQGKRPAPSQPSSSGSPTKKRGTSDEELRKILEKDYAAVPNLTDAQKRLWELFREINGQDAYSAEAVALGRLKQDEYLALPLGVACPRVLAHEVGDQLIQERFSPDYIAAVYALNKARAPAGVDAVRYGLARMEAVKCGWVDGQHEIVYLPAPEDAMDTFLADLDRNRDLVEVARLVAFLQPLVACHTFLTFGHHYLSGLAADYEERYRRTFLACIANQAIGYLPPAVQYHHMLHWVGPARARAVWEAQLAMDRIPEALKIRFASAPAGAALVTTTAAVLDAMKGSKVYAEVVEACPDPIANIVQVANKVREKATAYHKLYRAFGAQPPSVDELREFEEAKKICERFAPVAQGYIDGMFQDSALARAKVLKKHADANPLTRRRAERFFRDMGRNPVGKTADLFQASG